jgi:cell wall-associated NlpC family hydrolase
MTDPGQAIAAAAVGLIGTPFRFHGRDAATGLDCVGLVAVSLAEAGYQPLAPSGYALRNLAIDQWLACAERSGLMMSPGPMVQGDVLLIALGRCQHHLGIADSAHTIIHAHAGLRHVVRQTLEPAWHICAKWRASPSLKG